MNTTGTHKILVCGTRSDKMDGTDRLRYSILVQAAICAARQPLEDAGISQIIILHGGCEESADNYAEDLILRGQPRMITSKIFRGTPGTYLKRNIEMVQECDEVYAFWDGFSYGTAHTIATAALHKKKLTVWDLRDKEAKFP